VRLEAGDHAEHAGGGLDAAHHEELGVVVAAALADEPHGEHRIALQPPRPAPEPVAEQLSIELLDDRVRRAGLLEALEQVRERAAHFGVGVERHVPELVIDQADRQPDTKLAAGGLREQPALQRGADEVKLCLADSAFETEQQPVVDRAWVIKPVLVADQRPKRTTARSPATGKAI